MEFQHQRHMEEASSQQADELLTCPQELTKVWGLELVNKPRRTKD